jgi:hypothetical protein
MEKREIYESPVIEEVELEESFSFGQPPFGSP